MRTSTSASDPRPCAPRFTRLKSRRNCAARLTDRTPRPPCRADHLWSRASSAIASPGVASSTTSPRLAASSPTYRNRRHGRRWHDLTGPPAQTVSDQAGARATGRAVGHGFDRPSTEPRASREHAVLNRAREGGEKGASVVRKVAENARWRHSSFSFLWYDLWYDLFKLLFFIDLLAEREGFEPSVRY